MTLLFNKSNNRRGFTLVELLIVVAIIGTLATIALPQFQSYRARAYDSAALSDITQFRAAVVNADSFTESTGTWTSDFHPLFTEVSISDLVTIEWSTTIANGQAFYAWACSTNGEKGYFIAVPYGDYTGAAANQILTGALYRAAAGC